uniref:Ubiquitin carboxyl-terminal hydrolase n=1 Tax=Sander lucioperca TaxID=283035 RepID=A0A8D0A221_SANLU
MGKKRGKDKSSREDDDIELTGPSCRHIKKGTDQTLLKKLSGNSDWTSCQDCKHEENKENISSTAPQDSEEEKETASVWMCLKCGHRGCGRNSENQHAIKHSETPRSDPHLYCCDSLLEVDQKTDTVKADKSEDVENKENKDRQKKNAKKESVGKSPKSGTSEDNGGVSVKGLSNLGNTCFFNAVIQNLSQTQLLRQTLNKVTREKMSLNIKPVASSDLEPIVMQLDQPGSLTLSMCQLLNEIQETKKGVVTPRELFTQVCKKAARFKGFQQQDSQELLRYLLDGMRAEEIKRVSSGITEALKESRKITDGEQLKTLVKEYEKNGFPKNFVDHVFGGETTSTIMCQQCKTVSVVTEMFLDLSLPVSDEVKPLKVFFCQFVEHQDGRNSPALTNGNDDSPTGSSSKYQQKKAKKQAKKQAKHQKRQQKIEGRVTLDSLSSPSHTESKPTDPTADAKDEEHSDNETHEEASLSEGNPAQVGASEQDQKNSDVSVFDDDMDQEGEEDTRLVSDMEKVTLDDAFIEEPDAVEQSMEIEDEPLEAKEYTVVSQDPRLAFKTLATRTAPEKQECSVQSCLFQFTAVETLTQNNSLLCVTCTKRQPNKDKAGGSKKNVYTDALKQMLISSPPPVLTLHLKRFQQNGYSICKVNRHVQFPLILDLAPFCAVKCDNLTEGDFQILYSLYGIVEHSGTMRSGHYTAYVKAIITCFTYLLTYHFPSGHAEPPRGSWFHISDTSVQPVSESKVQSCQAYLLFYERIL